MRARIWFFALVLAACGRQAAVGTSPSAVKEAPADPWVLSCVDPNAKEPAWLSNGLIGVRIGRDGSGVGQPFFAIDEFNTTGEEKIRTLPNPLGVQVSLDGQFMSPAQGSLYGQTLDMRTSALETTWQQDGTKIDVLTYLHPSERTFAQKILIQAAGDHRLKLRSSIDGGPGFVGGGEMASIPLNPDGMIVNVNHRVEGETRPWELVGGGLELSTSVKSGASFVVYRSVRLSESPNAQKMLAVRHPGMKDESGLVGLEGMPDAASEFLRVRAACEKTWARRWKTDIQIDGPVEDQQAVRSFLFYLQSAISPKGQMGVSPMALSNAQYGGHVFWDADIWVFPALALVNPEGAKAIPDYRLLLADQARRNFATSLPGGADAPDALKYPWESSVTGKETVPGPSRKELHITGSVLWGLRQAEALGLADGKSVDAAATRAAAYYRSIGAGGQIRDVMSPDENHIGDNDLYTNLLAQWLTGQQFKLPKDDKTFLTYDGDALRGYKQAAAILSIYPLQYRPAEKQAKAMMERFANKVTANGPAMSDSVDATIWVRFGESDRAYDSWRKSWRDFTHNPLLLFSEKRKKPVTYFVTGAGGSLQSVVYGFLGFRLDSLAELGSAWSMKLKGEHFLSVRPHLPTAWKAVKFTNFAVLGRRFTLSATHNGATVSPGE